jgi:Immunity protein 74
MKRTIELTRSTLRILIDGRSVTAEGEAYLPGHGSPDFVVYSNTITRWDDGEPISDRVREAILRAIEQEASSLGIRIEIE